jgi:DNA topoisomerase-1
MSKSKNLVIVESPAKAKTIQKYLGSDFEVESSFGHIRDLPKKNDAIDIENNFEPKYIINPDKKKVVAKLKSSAKGKTVWLASDEDREGEAIAWHLCEALKLDPAKTNRIVFHEITEGAIKKAIKEPRTVDLSLVDAQQARRVLDRLVGFGLSPILWQKIKFGLSAGRVQSVAVRLVVEREKEINNTKIETYYKIKLELEAESGEQFEAVYPEKIKNLEDAEAILKSLADSGLKLKVIEVTKKPGLKRPQTPLTTSALQQAASQTMGMSPKSTMSNAQRLYEAGLITYMRTDSLNLSEQALGAIESEVSSRWGKDHLNLTRYKSKSAGAQEAHEAIRPTDFKKEFAGSDEYQKRLYNLIWRRTMASQMAPAKTEKTIIKLKCQEIIFQAEGEVITFEGFLAAMGRSSADGLLPNLQQGDQVKVKSGEAKTTLAKRPARYTEASLIKKLEELGIGRPSTYAPTLSTIEARGYVEKGDKEGKPLEVINLSLIENKLEKLEEVLHYGADKGRLIPTDTGSVVTEFLERYMPDIMDYKFTADMEARFDEIAAGKDKWQDIIKKFYTKFNSEVTSLKDIKRSDVGQRILGNDPKTGKPVIARIGRFGAMLQIGESGEDVEEKPVFANMPAGKNIEDVTLDEALEMFKLPKTLGQFEAEDVKVNIGRFGPYIQHDGKYISVKGRDIHAMTLDEAIAEIKLKREADKDKFIADWGDVQILRGPYGIYIKGVKLKKNAKIPKDMKPEDITEAEARKLLDEAPERKNRGRWAKKVTTVKRATLNKRVTKKLIKK